LRGNRRLVVAIIGILVLGLVIGLVTDLIRIGPSAVALSPDAMTVTLEILRISDGDNLHDYYYVVVTVSNTVVDPSIQPYEATVTLNTNAGDGTLKHTPSLDDDGDTPFTISFPDVDRTFTFPVGTVHYDERTSGAGHWILRGESGMKSRPIFRDVASFVLEVAIGEGGQISASAIVDVAWYYHSAVQAYPVASRSIATPTLVIPSGPPSI
jgi:hypothetical protein